MKKLTLIALAFLVLLPAASAVLSADEDKKKDDEEKAPEPADLNLINIHVFPSDIIVINGKTMRLKEVEEHLKDLVPDSRKSTVEVVVRPYSKTQMSVTSKIILTAKKVGYTKVSYVSPPKPRKKKVSNIVILVSKTGNYAVNGAVVSEKEFVGHLEKLVPVEKDREKVQVVVLANRLVKMKNITETINTCRKLGFKKVRFVRSGE